MNESAELPLEQSPNAQENIYDFDREDSGAEEFTTETPHDEDGEPQRGRGRPKLIKTGRPGRPKKEYGKRRETANQTIQELQILNLLGKCKSSTRF